MIFRHSGSGSAVVTGGRALVAAALAMGCWGCSAPDPPPPTAEEAAQQPPLEAPKGPGNSVQSELRD